MVYIGETHNRYEDHLLQLRVIRALYHQNPDLAIGMEMFNRADQEVLDAYVLNHEIDEAEFLRRTHYFTNWRYDYRYYQPIVNFARANRIPVIALNLPQKTVSEVFKGEGLSGLTEKQQAQIPPDRDLAMSGYRERIGSFFQMHRQAPGQPGNFNNFLQAQAIWDETMAASVADFLEARPDYRMAVVAGRGHIEKENAHPTPGDQTAGGEPERAPQCREPGNHHRHRRLCILLATGRAAPPGFDGSDSQAGR